jgi:hypothetical protein
VKVHTSEESWQHVRAERELTALLSAVRAGDRPQLLRLESKSGAVLEIGLAGSEACLLFWQEDGEEMSHSLGERWRSEPLELWFGDSLEERGGELAIPADVAIAAALAFFTDGKRPGGVTWEHDDG